MVTKMSHQNESEEDYDDQASTTIIKEIRSSIFNMANCNTLRSFNAEFDVIVGLRKSAHCSVQPEVINYNQDWVINSG